MRQLLANPVIYRLQQSLVWSDKQDFNALLLAALSHLESRLGRKVRVLDIGCGDGKLAAKLGLHCEYRGVDLSPAYIEHARKIYGGYGDFQVADIGNPAHHALLTQAMPDLILMIGVMHHCDDAAIMHMLASLREQFPNAAFVSIDGVFLPGQHWFAKLLLQLDRGEFIRNVEGYRRLLPTHDYMLRNFLRVPFDMIVFYKGIPLDQLAARLFGEQSDQAPTAAADS